MGAFKVKGKLSSMPSNCAKMKYCSPDVPWEEAQKLMVIKLSKMGVSVKHWTWFVLHNSDINVLPANGDFYCLLITFANILGPV